VEMHRNLKNTKSKNTSNWQYVTMMLLMVVVWALAFPFIKIGLQDLSFVNLTIMRFIIVCIVLFMILILKSEWFSKLHKQDIIPIFILGFFGVIVYHFGLNYGEQFISPGAASLIIATIPVYIIILAAIFLKEKIRLIKLLGIILALCGVIIISLWGTEDASIEIKYITAALAVLIAAIMGALYTIAGKKLLERYNGLSLTVYAILLGSIGLIPFILLSNFGLIPSISKPLLAEVAAMSTNSWIAILFLGILSTTIGYIIWYVALEIKTASEISVYLYAIPVISTIVSYFIFDDKITLFFLLGGLLVIVGLIIVNMKFKNNDKKID
jgi:drug/metabolite transporter (DMT)-like permease